MTQSNLLLFIIILERRGFPWEARFMLFLSIQFRTEDQVILAVEDDVFAAIGWGVLVDPLLVPALKMAIAAARGNLDVFIAILFVHSEEVIIAPWILEMGIFPDIKLGYQFKPFRINTLVQTISTHGPGQTVQIANDLAIGFVYFGWGRKQATCKEHEEQ